MKDSISNNLLIEAYEKILSEGNKTESKQVANVPENKEESELTKKPLNTKPYGDKKMVDNWDQDGKRNDLEDAYTLKENLGNMDKYADQYTGILLDYIGKDIKLGDWKQEEKYLLFIAIGKQLMRIGENNLKRIGQTESATH